MIQKFRCVSAVFYSILALQIQYIYNFDLHRAVHHNIISILKTN